MSSDKIDQTESVHGGDVKALPMRSITMPVAIASTFRFDSTAALQAHLRGDAPQPDYARYSNPTVREAERRLARLAGAEDAVLMASGMAAVTTSLLTFLSAGQHMIFLSDVYRPSREFIGATLRRFGIQSSCVSPDDVSAIEDAMQDNTRVIFCEFPTNPHLRVADLRAISALKKKRRGVQLIVDATLASPLNARVLALGADIVIESATKFLSGHNDLVAGVVCGRSGRVEAVRELRSLLGPTLDAQTAYLLLRSLKTFALRMKAHNEHALAVAEALEAHPNVERVFYPGLASHPDHAVASDLMSGFGGVVSFHVRGDLDAASAVVDRVRLIQHGASLGGAESLIHQPAIFSYSDLTSEERAAQGIADNLIRVSVGLEEATDIVADLYQALEG